MKFYQLRPPAGLFVSNGFEAYLTGLTTSLRAELQWSRPTWYASDVLPPAAMTRLGRTAHLLCDQLSLVGRSFHEIL